MQCGVTRQTDAANQHHHQPCLVRIERLVGAEIAVRQDRQHDKGQHAELQHRNQIAACHAFRYSAQLRFEIKQGGDGYGQHDGQFGKTIPDHRAQPVTHQQGDDRGGAGVGFFARIIQVRGDDHAGNGNQTGDQQPGRIEFCGEQRGQCAEQGDQCKGAQPCLGRWSALALQSDQQTDGEAGKELRPGLYAVVLQKTDIHRSTSVLPASGCVTSSDLANGFTGLLRLMI